jgi:hypothetical protein
LAKYISTACWAFNFCGAWERKYVDTIMTFNCLPLLELTHVFVAVRYVDTMIAPLEINPNAAAEAQQEMMQQSF